MSARYRAVLCVETLLSGTISMCPISGISVMGITVSLEAHSYQLVSPAHTSFP